jgi:hypothetical protein
VLHRCITEVNMCASEQQQATLVLSQRGPVPPESKTSYLSRPTGANHPVVPNISVILYHRLLVPNIPSIFPTHQLVTERRPSRANSKGASKRERSAPRNNAHLSRNSPNPFRSACLRPITVATTDQMKELMKIDVKPGQKLCPS